MSAISPAQPVRHDPPWWVVILAIPLFGTSLIFALFAGLGGVSLIDSVTASHSVTDTTELATGGSVTVNASSSAVVIEAGPEGQVSVQDWMQVKSPTRSLARAALSTFAQSSVSTTAAGDTVTIPSPEDFNLTAFNLDRRVTIRMPAGADLKLRADAAAVDLHDLRGNLDLTVSAGAIRLLGVTVNGSDRITATAGAVAFDGTLQGGTLDIETESGAIAVHLPAGTNASYDLATTNGAILVQPGGGQGTTEAGSNRTATGVLGTGGGTAIRLRARSGAVSLIVGR
jgi:hypothetical protein